MRTIGHGRQFGFEEMVRCQKERLFRARAVGHRRAELISLSKQDWLKQLSKKDVFEYFKLGEGYCDMKSDGQNLYAEMLSKKKHLNTFLDAAKFNNAPKGQSKCRQVELAPEQSSLKGQRRQKSLQNYV